jgi:hypothetical protein
MVVGFKFSFTFTWKICLKPYTCPTLVLNIISSYLKDIIILIFVVTNIYLGRGGTFHVKCMQEVSRGKFSTCGHQ